MIKAKILLDLPSDIIDTIRLEEQWENEGGSTPKNIIDECIPDSKLPFHPGDSFKVISGHIEQVDNQFYYSVDLEQFEAKIHQ